MSVIFISHRSAENASLFLDLDPRAPPAVHLLRYLGLPTDLPTAISLATLSRDAAESSADNGLIRAVEVGRAAQGPGTDVLSNGR